MCPPGVYEPWEDVLGQRSGVKLEAALGVMQGQAGKHAGYKVEDPAHYPARGTVCHV